jgi:hypothetical protein
VLTIANATGTNGLTCLPKHGGARDNKFWSPILRLAIETGAYLLYKAYISTQAIEGLCQCSGDTKGPSNIAKALHCVTALLSAA